MDAPLPFTHQEVAQRAETTDRILSELREEHARQRFELFLCYFYNSHFDPEGFNVIRTLGITSINFYCNSIYQFELVAEIAKSVDFSWHSERDARDDYLRAGAKPVWVQMGADPEVCFRPIRDTCIPRACFVGQPYCDRVELATGLLAASLPLDLYGSGWPHPSSNPGAAQPKQETAPPPLEYLGRRRNPTASVSSYVDLARRILRNDGLWRGAARIYQILNHRRCLSRNRAALAVVSKGRAKDVATTYSEYAVGLNFSNVWHDGIPCGRKISHVRLRDFEAPMAGTCYLTGYSNELEEFYTLGSEIDAYNCPEELIDKTRFYLTHPEAANSLRRRGQERALSSHTWDHRFRELFSRCSLT